jgi:hypothetical protein
VAFNDEGYSYKGILMKFDGNSWITVGSGGFSIGVAKYLSLAFSPSGGQPYVAFSDASTSFKSTVMKYDSVMAGIDEKQKSKLSLYPNPASNLITVETLSTLTQYQLSIMNVDGQQLITRQITQPKTQLDISNLPSGVYFVRITNNRTLELGKFVKQ